MNSPASGSEAVSSEFALLDERIQRWIWEKGWTELRDAQEKAIPPLLKGQQDVIIAAATAAGKTEAAFLPLLTRLLGTPEALILAVSPLKALINDQWGRLEELCERLEVPVTPWHGDIASGRKRHFLKKPAGCLLITPESLEALLMRHGLALSGLFSGLLAVVIDELHSFLGTERGRQLQSQLQRLEILLGRGVPRIGLSATLGDMRLAEEFLRPGQQGRPVLSILSRESGQELRVLIKGYRQVPQEDAEDKQAGETSAETPAMMNCEAEVARHIFKTFRGSNNLIFPNSRRHVEQLTDLLRRMSEDARLPDEFWPHHGSLSRELREETEAALKCGDRPATAICTSTLELGIDIGAVRRIGQVGPAPSVASLRQRLGRSGRRQGEPAILFGYAIEQECRADSPLSDLLREGLVQTIAQIRLLVRGWYEPPPGRGLHLSTLIQQLLSVIVQYGGVTASQAWNILGAGHHLTGLSQTHFRDLLRALGRRDILMQDASGLLMLAPKGEALTSHYSFYAAFVSPEEFQIVTEGKILGSLPVSSPMEAGSYIIFAGRRWQVDDLDRERKIIRVHPAKGGQPPAFEGSAAPVTDGVRQEMLQVLTETSPVPFLDATAQELLAEAREHFRRMGLGRTSLLEGGRESRLFPWAGDKTMNSLAMLLRHHGLEATNDGLSLVVLHPAGGSIVALLTELIDQPPPEAAVLAAKVLNKQDQKWDWLLPEGLLTLNYASHHLDVSAAMRVLRDVATGMD